ncbi:MAG TPA: hypothetical protein VIK89_09730 [Cytophagaceae bacterium]
MLFRLLKISFLLLLLPSMLKAQTSITQFGKNRVQHKEYQWKFISTYNFDIYFYEGGEELARKAAVYVEKEYTRLTDQLNYTPYSRIKILIYNTATDLHGSNIGLESDETFMGGHTNFVKSKIEVAFTGSHELFQKELRHELSSIILHMMLFGGSFKDIVQSSYLLSFPEWFLSGASAYLADGWSVEMDNYVRDAFLFDRIKNSSTLSGKDAEIIGQSIWNYIEQLRGKSAVAGVLGLSRILRNEKSSIETGLGISYQQFMYEWKKFYTSDIESLKSAYVFADAKNKLFNKKRRDIKYENLNFNKEGEYLLFTGAEKGRLKIYLHDFKRGKSTSVIKAGAKLFGQKPDPNLCHISWISSDVFAAVINKKNKSFLYKYDVKNNQSSAIAFNHFRQVVSADVSSDGKYIVLSADKAGQNDLFLYEVSSGRIKQVTNDIADDLDPVFIEDSYSFVFSSNRCQDTLAIKSDSLGNFHLYVFSPSHPGVVQKMNHDGNSSKPVIYDANTILYLNDHSGITNIYKLNLNTGEENAVSNFISKVITFDVSKNTNSIAYVLIQDGKEQIYVDDDFFVDKTYPLPLTFRETKLNPRQERKQVEIPDISGGSIQDSTETTYEIDINNYRFESDVIKITKPEIQPTENKVNILDISEEIKITGPYPAKNSFSIDQVISTLRIDPLRGLGIVIIGNMSDMMGNHRINMGIFGLSDLRSSNVFGEYIYLKKRMDQKIRFDRQSLILEKGDARHYYTLNKFAYTFSYPFSVRSRFTAGPELMHSRYSDISDPNTITFPDKTVLYTGLKTELVYDNTTVYGLNMMKGNRAKVSFNWYAAPGEPNKDFGKLMLDLRNYLPIHKEIVLATRLSYGEFVGSSKKKFLIGGMDNWFFNSTNFSDPNTPLTISKLQDNSDLLFTEFVTPMRGFPYNAKFGPKYTVLNNELRFPIVKYLYNGPINSNFFRNLQLIGFTDIGTAWSGTNPFTQSNSTNTQVIDRYPFSATVVNYRNPFLIGYGFGFRTLFLGYYLKFDVAWGKADAQPEERKFYLTFGYDF